MASENQLSTYWHENFPLVCAALEEVTGDELSANAEHLALIAGDHSVMGDDEVLATLINESLPK